MRLIIIGILVGISFVSAANAFCQDIDISKISYSGKINAPTIQTDEGNLSTQKIKRIKLFQNGVASFDLSIYNTNFRFMYSEIGSVNRVWDSSNKTYGIRVKVKLGISSLAPRPNDDITLKILKVQDNYFYLMYPSKKNREEEYKLLVNFIKEQMNY